MKTLITILLAPVSVMGQSQLMPIENIRCNRFETVWADLPVIITSDPHSWPKTYCITTQDLLDYKRECWNDSTKQWVHQESPYSYNDSTGIGISQGIYVMPKREWTHKPPTFEGFLNWIEKRKR
jgi:hypothetical protein